MSSATTSIEWTDRTWNPTRGCSRVSPGCENCYAERTAARFSNQGAPYAGLVRPGKNGPRWTGKVVLVPKALAEPLRWRKPARIFVNSMSDLFHESLTDEEIAAVFGVMAACPQHTFQVLTKRAERMARWFEWATSRSEQPASYCMETAIDALRQPRLEWPTAKWPLVNAWIGVSVEDQQRADERIPHLLRCPATVRFLSVEPLLGPVDLARYFRHCAACQFTGMISVDGPPWEVQCSCSIKHIRAELSKIGWVIVGGESGPGARPFDVAWLRVIVRQCRADHVPMFVKQLGAHVITRNDDGLAGTDDGDWQLADPDGQVEHDLDGTRDGYQGAPVRVHLRDRKGGDPEEWPVDLRVREFPKARS